LDNCPSSACSLPGVIWADEVTDYRRTLKVTNMDMVKQEFRFRINLVDKDIENPTPADYVMLDPIGDNQDRGSLGTRDSLSVIATVGVGLLAGLAAFTAAEMFLPNLAW